MIQIIALLFAGDKGIEGLREFESRAIEILREHQGELISASFNDVKGADEPDEIHVIQFPSPDHFNAYKNDKRLIELASLKNAMVNKMQVYITNRFYQY
ncbi:hypothetical protein Q4575_10815 [Psychrosphaera sp. 1_MG-2023]|uniref:hypothetical protein n=1 Tax=Psychrosphaera sp. 1_MG-2023 TaxID=3062643 RepID=UPI0026E11F7E|nr:hypothetical protein [Psychrosphaera sp. 1_MG-2023]MDO6719896.1 hypothetical protein [Psychrosphaera sp. 1_MG-2023]